MTSNPLRTTVIGSYPFPGWLEFACQHLDQFGAADRAELQDDAVIAAIHDQMASGLDVITDGEQTRLDFNLSFYGYLEGIELEGTSPRRFGPPAHDQRGKHKVTGELRAPRGLGAVEEFKRLQRLFTAEPQRAQRKITLKASVPGPYTLSGRLTPNGQYLDRWALTEALLPMVRKELEDLVAAGCKELSVDEPSMSCYAYREDTKRFVDIFNRTVESVSGRARVCTHLCFGNYKARAVGPRRLDVALGIVDVKSYFIETPPDVADRVRRCLKFAPADRLVFAPDCGLSQTARWAARQKLINLVAGVELVRRELNLSAHA